ncbi:hypothetical protein ACOMHN_061162 [Nucella lapillus]
MKMTTGTWVISFMLTTIAVLLLNVSNVTGAVCCNAYGSTINCTLNSTASRPWTLCEIMFPSEPSCPGDTPRPNITSLLLGSSGLRNLSRYALLRLPRLETLDLRNNHLSRFPRVQTGWLPNSVLKLDVSYNSLEALPRYAFRGMLRFQTHLETLNLSWNCFHTLPLELAHLHVLKMLDLSHNVFLPLNPSDRMVLSGMVGNLSLNLNGNPFSRTCSNEDFFGWWSSKFQIQATSVEDSRLSAGPKAELRCVSGRGGSMSVKHLLENCAADSLGFSTGLKVLVCVVSLVVVVLVTRVKGYRHCGRTDSESGIEEFL